MQYQELESTTCSKFTTEANLDFKITTIKLPMAVMCWCFLFVAANLAANLLVTFTSVRQRVTFYTIFFGVHISHIFFRHGSHRSMKISAVHIGHQNPRNVHISHACGSHRTYIFRHGPNWSWAFKRWFISVMQGSHRSYWYFFAFTSVILIHDCVHKGLFSV